MRIEKERDRAIAAYFQIPADIQRQASYATWDLYHGLSGGGLEDEDENGEPLYLGFTAACALVSDWCNDNLSEVWYDIQSGEVLLSEPKGSYEDCPEYDGILSEDLNTDDTICPACKGDGRVWIEPLWEDYYNLEEKDVKRSLFDKKLVAHL